MADATASGIQILPSQTPARKGGNPNWVKGKSGNPGGRPKAVKKFLEQIHKLTPKAIKVLGEALDSDDDKVRFAAAHETLDRSLGKPAQAITGPQGEPLALSIQIDLSGGQNAK